MSYKEPNDEFFINLAQGLVAASVIIWITMQLTGCASQQEMEILAHNSTAVAQMQAQASMTQKETVSATMDCTQGCGKAKVTISYIDPRDRQKVTGVSMRGTNDVIIGVAPSVTNAIGWIAGSIAATKIVSDIASTAGGGNTTTHTTTSLVGDDNSEVGKSSLSTNDGPVTDNSNQNNPADNSATASPTVVTQPSPLVVNQ